MTTDAELLDLRGEIQRLRRCIGTLFNQQSLFTPSRESTLSPIVVMLRKIAAAAESLEEQLAERTHELTAANEALGREIVEHARAEEALGVAREALARAARVTNIGELTASIAHEVNQPLAAIVTNGEASLRWLAAEPPNLREVHGAVERVVGDANRASEVIARIHAFLSRGKSCVTRFQVEDTVADVIALARDKALQCGVSLREEFAADVPSVEADRVQLQQVILNLVMNGIEAMSAITSHARNLVVGVKRYAPDAILVTVRDSGNGLDPQQRARIFQSFYTTKADGIGMGLAISRSIVNAHGGRLWSTSNDDIGETFQFTLPTAGASTA